MFILNEKNEINRNILNYDFIRYSPSEISNINTPTSQVYFIIPREDSVISLLISYLKLNFDVLHAATNNRYIDGIDRRLVNLGPIALFGNYKLTTSSGKQLENFDHAHIVSLMNKLLPSSRGSNDLSIGFDRDRDKRRLERNINKNKKRKLSCQNVFKRYIWNCTTPKKDTYGLGCKLTWTRNTDNAVLNKGNAINIGKLKSNAMEWYVPHYTPSLDQYRVLMKQPLDKTPTQL